MSGGPQVFLGATTFSGCRSARSPAAARPARPRDLATELALGASSRSPARPRSPRGGLQSGGATMLRPGLASAHGQRSQAPQASRRPPIARTSCSVMSHVIPLRVFQILKSHRWNCNVFSGSRKLTVGNYVRFLFWLTSWRRSTDNETPLSNDAVRGLLPTTIRWPSASELPHRCTRRSTPRRRWVGSSRAGSPEVGST